jgi:hypothetical protein
MTLIFDEIFFLATDTFVLAKGMINFALREREKEDDRLYMFLMTRWAFGSTVTLVNININSLMYAMYAIKTLCTQIHELECTFLSSIDCSIRAFTWPFTIE